MRFTRLVIENKTRWDGRAIRSLVLAGLKAHGIEGCSVLVRYKRRGAQVCGRATIGGRWMELLMPRDPRDPEVEARWLSSVIDHECYHLLGVENHGAFPKHARWCSERGAPWHPEGSKVEHLPEAETSEDEAQVAKLEHARTMLAKAQTRLKRAKTIEQKWRRRVAAQEKKLAAGRTK